MTVLGDAVYEPNETFYLNLSTPSGATIADSQGIATITNDDAAPTLAVNDVTVTEGNSGFTYFNFTVTLSSASSSTVTVSYATASGTAISGSDFSPRSGSLTFSAGQTSKTVQVPIYGDTAIEPNEIFYLNLSGATNATIADSQGVCTIVNDDPTMPSLTINDSMVGEGDSGSATGWFPVYLSAASTQTVTVNYSTSPGTATAGVDYASATGTLTFVPGDTVEYIPVTIYGDTAYEPNDYFYLNLSSATNATIADNQSVVSIQNNDPDTTNPAIFVTDASVTEGNTGTATTTFTVSLSQATGSTVTVNYTTNPGSATAGIDYTSASGTLTFAPGETIEDRDRVGPR